MNRNAGLILALALGTATLPAAAQAQKCEGKNNVWTRSAALYLDRAAKNQNAEEKQEMLTKALEQTTEGTQKDADNPRLWFLHGQVQSRVGNLAAADAAWDKVEQICADRSYDQLQVERMNSWIVNYNAGVQAAEEQNMELAIEKMTAADLIYQGRPEARVNLGVFYANAGQNDKAAEAFGRALELLNDEELRADLSDEQKATWAQLEEVSSFNMAQLHALAGRHDQAAAAYRAYLVKNPDNLPARQNLAIVLSQAGKADEAAQIYSELLDRPGMAATDYFNIGVGLFSANMYDRAAAAFRKAVETNPHMRDARYNLTQALYAPSLTLDSIRANSTGAAKTEASTKLRAVYEELIAEGEKLLEVDPNNANAILILARANRGLADIAATKTEGDRYRQRVLALLERQQKLPFSVGDLVTVGTQSGLKVVGTIGNLNLKEGTPVAVRFTFLGKDGSTITTKDVTVAAPAAGTSSPFEVEADGLEIAGWKYEVVK